MKKIIPHLITSFIFSGLLTLWLVMSQFHKLINSSEITPTYLSLFFSWGTVLYFIVIFVILLSLMVILKPKMQQITAFLYRYRYAIAAVLLLTGVTFELSGSSIGIWSNYLKSNEYQNVILGVSRQIRSDEWATNISFIFAQGLHSPTFPYFNELIRSTATDMFIVSSAPVATLGIIFKPAFIGYLFLGISKGMSFYWIFRFLLLFLSLFELGMLLTNKNKKLSLILTSLVSFSSVLQWWFVAAGLVEMISVGAIAILLIERYFTLGTQYVKKIAIALALIWCAVTYALTLYPAWQVPVAYLYSAIIVYILIEKIKNHPLKLKQDGLIIGGTIILTIIILLLLLLPSLEHIQAMTSTVYPGRRFEVGGGASYLLTDYPYSIFYSITNINSERFMDVMYDLFPFSYFFSIFAFWKTRDKLVGFLLLISTFFLIFISIGVPSFIAQISFLSISTSFRLVSIFGLVNIFLLIRSLAVYSIPMKKMAALIVAIVFSSSVSYFTYKNGAFFFDLVANNISSSSVFKIGLIIVSYLFLLGMIYIILRQDLKKILFGVFVLSFLTGVMVNPIQKGVDVVQKSNIVQSLSGIEAQENDIWLVDNLMFPENNIPLLAGKKTLNSTSVYPNLTAWRSVDKKKQFEEIYNRFSHVNVQLSTEGDFSASLVAADSILLSLPVSDLMTLKVNYVLTNRNLEDFSTDEIHFDFQSDVDGFRIYKVSYSQ